MIRHASAWAKTTGSVLGSARRSDCGAVYLRTGSSMARPHFEDCQSRRSFSCAILTSCSKEGAGQTWRLPALRLRRPQLAYESRVPSVLTLRPSAFSRLRPRTMVDLLTPITRMISSTFRFISQRSLASSARSKVSLVQEAPRVIDTLSALFGSTLLGWPPPLKNPTRLKGGADFLICRHNPPPPPVALWAHDPVSPPAAYGVARTAFR